jgi:hypothetical protein
LNTEQRYEQDGGSCHPPAETELVTGISFNDKYSGVCYNERVLQRTVCINNIRMLQRTRGNSIGRRSTRVSMTCPAFPL